MTSIKSLVGCIVGPFLAASLQELHKQSALGAVAVGVVVVVAAVVVVVVAVVVVVVVGPCLLTVFVEVCALPVVIVVYYLQV